MIHDCNIAKKAREEKSVEKFGNAFVEGPELRTIFYGEGSIKFTEI